MVISVIKCPKCGNPHKDIRFKGGQLVFKSDDTGDSPIKELIVICPVKNEEFKVIFREKGNQ